MTEPLPALEPRTATSDLWRLARAATLCCALVALPFLSVTVIPSVDMLQHVAQLKLFWTAVCEAIRTVCTAKEDRFRGTVSAAKSMI